MIQTRKLSSREAEALGYDTVALSEFPVVEMSVPGAFLDYEEGPRTIWILYIETEPARRRQGLATQLIQSLKIYADKSGKSVVPGTFTKEGEQFLKPLIARLNL